MNELVVSSGDMNYVETKAPQRPKDTANISIARELHHCYTGTSTLTSRV